MVCIVGLSLFSQQVTEESVVINVEVPVRVFAGGDFVDNLTIDDFELLEDGLTQRIEAVYLVKKRSIERSEEKRRFSPETARNFFLFFELTEQNPKLEEAVDYFIRNAIYPGDNLTIVTPMKTYQLRGKALEVKSRKEIIEQLKGLIRRDTLIGSSEYNNTIQALEGLARSLSATIVQTLQEEEAEEALTVFQQLDEVDDPEYMGRSVDEQLQIYYDLLMKLESIRRVDEKQMFNLAEYLKDQEGQKYVYMFYQKEYVPQVDPNILGQYMALYQDRPDLIQTVSSLFDFFKRDIEFDVDAVKKAYADSSVSIHFLYITKPVQRRAGVYMNEQSEDIFGPFREMARATGGFSDSSANADYLFQEAVEASDNYYLLYYSPQKYISDGKFKNITVRIRGKNYRITHRLGYFAN